MSTSEYTLKDKAIALQLSRTEQLKEYAISVTADHRSNPNPITETAMLTATTAYSIMAGCSLANAERHVEGALAVRTGV